MMQEVPHNIEAEQQLLGALLIGRDDLGRILGSAITAGGSKLFCDPVHVKIFETIRTKSEAGHLVSPITLRDSLINDAGLNDLGGPRYLVRLAAAAIMPDHAEQYIDLLADLCRKRELIDLMAEAQASISRGGESADVISGKLESALMMAAPVGANRPVSMLAATTDALVAANNAYQGLDAGGISSGIRSLDHMVPGFFPGELILLGGRPSMGKTAVALAFGLNAARAGHGVCIASLEMTPDSMAMRALSEATAHSGRSVSYKQMRTGDMEEIEMREVVEVSQTVGRLPIQFLPPSYRDIGAMMAGVKQVRTKMGGNLRLVIIDYLQLLRGNGKGRYEEITEISIALKAMALQLGVPVIALSQLSRAVEQREDKRPQMADLRESGQLEQDADTILFCYRDEYYLERDRPAENDYEALSEWQQVMEMAKGKLEVIVAKQRQGDIGTAHMRFNAATNLIWEE